MDLLILGLILDIIGVVILTLVAIIDYPHQRVFGEDKGRKMYWWMAWRPIFKVCQPQEKPRWIIRFTHKVGKEGFIPPNHFWSIIGLILIMFGFCFQLISYLQ